MTLRFVSFALCVAVVSTSAAAAPPALCADLSALQASFAGEKAPLPATVLGSAQCKREANGVSCVARGDSSRLLQLWSDAARDIDSCVGEKKKAMRRSEREIDGDGAVTTANLVRVWDDWDLDVYFVAAKSELSVKMARRPGIGNPLPAVVDWPSLEAKPETCARLKELQLRPEKPALWDLECSYISSDVSRPELRSKHDTIECVVPRIPQSGGLAAAFDGVSRALTGCLSGWSQSSSESNDSREPLPARISHQKWKGPNWKISGMYADRTGKATFFFEYRQ